MLTAAVAGVHFTGTLTSGTASLTVAFTDSSTGSPCGRAWFFSEKNYPELLDAYDRECRVVAKEKSFRCVAMPDGSFAIFRKVLFLKDLVFMQYPPQGSLLS